MEDVKDIKQMPLSGIKEQDLSVIVQHEMNPVGHYTEVLLIDQRDGQRYSLKSGYVTTHRRL